MLFHTLLILLSILLIIKKSLSQSLPYLCGDISNCCNQQAHVLLSTLFTELPDRAFAQCRSLQSIVLPDKIVRLGIIIVIIIVIIVNIIIILIIVNIIIILIITGTETFADCSSLQSVIMPKFITEIPGIIIIIIIIIINNIIIII